MLGTTRGPLHMSIPLIPPNPWESRYCCLHFRHEKKRCSKRAGNCPKVTQLGSGGGWMEARLQVQVLSVCPLKVKATWLDSSLCLSPHLAQFFTHSSLSEGAVRLNYNQLSEGKKNICHHKFPFITPWWNRRGTDFPYLKNFCFMWNEVESPSLRKVSSFLVASIRI